MANPTIPMTEPAPAIVTRVSAAQVYENGTRTDKRVLDEQGRPVSRVRGFGRLFGSIQEITIEIPDHLAETVAPGQIVVAAGNRLMASLKGSDFGAVSMTVQGAEDLRIVGSADEVFDSLAKAGAK